MNLTPSPLEIIAYAGLLIVLGAVATGARLLDWKRRRARERHARMHQGR